MVQHSSRRIMTALASNNYIELEEQAAAMQIVQAIMAAGRRVPHQPSSTDAPQNSTVPSTVVVKSMTSDKLAHSMSMRLNDSEKNSVVPSGNVGWHMWMNIDKVLVITV